MKRWVWLAVRSFLVIVGIIVLTSFTIDATDTLSGSQSALSFLARSVTEDDCPVNMVKVDMAERSYCIDVYENSFTKDCPTVTPRSLNETQNNINESDCLTESVSEAIPAVFVTFHQAQTFCARRGGRLPSSLEWYEAALGTPDTEACNIDGVLGATGAKKECVSSRQTRDMVGNAWEWVDGVVDGGLYEGRELPPTGYVAEADRSGVALTTAGAPSDLFNQDYFWSADDNGIVMMRGGFYNSGSDAGIYSIHADIPPSFTSGGVGFRCVIST